MARRRVRAGVRDQLCETMHEGHEHDHLRGRPPTVSLQLCRRAPRDGTVAGVGVKVMGNCVGTCLETMSGQSGSEEYVGTTAREGQEEQQRVN